MPELSVGCSLRLRNCQMLNDPEWGVRLSISKDTKYPRSLVVKLLDPTMCGVNELLDRKNECRAEPADAASVSEDGDNATEEDAEDLPDATALSDVCASSKVNVRYRVRATVTKSYPSSVEESLVDDQCRAILELSDATDAADGRSSAKCLAFFLATTPPSLLKLLHLPADCVDKQEAMQRISRILAAPREVDLIVAACLVPGPHDIPTRCLLIEKFISPI
ncbi:hypothetical protein LPJ73_005970 [Coemansia sp. RSA 2703]|nr:hypothetical protein LPJ73_005970 [Coemansia sp. RSA 2703]